MLKYILILYMFCFSNGISAQTALKETWEKNWDQPDVNQISPDSLLNIYQRNQSLIGNNQKSQKLNDYYFIQKAGAYYIKHKGQVAATSKMLRQIPKIDLGDSEITDFMEITGDNQFVNLYFMLKALHKGATFEEARDGLEITTDFPGRPLNHYDYDKLECIILSGNKKLQSLYLEKLKFIFRNTGSTDGLVRLQPLIKKHVPTMPVKQEIMDLYTRYAPLHPGNPAPLTVFQDADGKEYRWTDFTGKVIVADVWATWCCVCLDRMPHFLELRNEYASNPDIIFVSVSIDRRDAWEKWKKAVEKNKMTPMLNLIAVAGESTFEADYCIAGVPRHIVIDKKGNIVDVYAPFGDELKELIEQTLKK